MKITTFGTRGSLPVAAPTRTSYGGNTTCLRVESRCLPAGAVLAIDAGTGFLPLCWEALRQGMKSLLLLHTHYHHDHTQGFLIAPPVYMAAIPITIAGPRHGRSSAKMVYRTIMRPPFHPVDFDSLLEHIEFHDIRKPLAEAILVHPEEGLSFVAAADLKSARKSGVLTAGKKRIPLAESLAITMHPTDHPGGAIAYRFDEGPSGRAFVFMTDEEVRRKVPASLKKFLHRADLMIQDAQYSEETYETRTKGYGHGTPSYAVSLAKMCKIRMVGLTHHDPASSDDAIAELAAGVSEEGRKSGVQVVACRDYQLFEL